MEPSICPPFSIYQTGESLGLLPHGGVAGLGMKPQPSAGASCGAEAQDPSPHSTEAPNPTTLLQGRSPELPHNLVGENGEELRGSASHMVIVKELHVAHKQWFGHPWYRTRVNKHIL